MTRPAVKAGVIAAGRGTRLGASGVLKPLARVAGRALIEHVLGSIAETGASEVTVIINADSLAIRRHVTALAWPFTLRWLVETTPSSMHSFLRIVETLSARGDEHPFLVSTADTIAAPGAFSRFLGRAAADADVTLAVTDRVDDEKPLRVRVDGSRVTAIGEAAAAAPLITAGYYLVRSSILAEADAARADGLMALRAFLARLLARGYRLDAGRVSESVDVDRPADVEAAEALLREVAR